MRRLHDPYKENADGKPFRLRPVTMLSHTHAFLAAERQGYIHEQC